MSKLDPRLNALVKTNHKMLREMKQRDDKEYRTAINKLEELKEKFGQAKPDPKTNEAFRKRIEEQASQIPIPSTFGLYFPEDDPKGVAKVTDLKEPFVSGTIRSDASAADLKALGIDVRQRAGNIFTCYIPLKQVSRLANSPGIDYIELARPWEESLGTGIPHANINALHGAAPAVTGNGTIVGIIDSYFDIYHPDFRNNDGVGGDGQGSTRVLFLWEQTMTPIVGENGPPVAPALPGFNPLGGATYGVEYSQANINAEFNNFQPSPDGIVPHPTPPYQVVRLTPGTAQHGTKVASAAVGGGRGASVGAAPGANIIYVRKGNGNNYVYADSTNVLDGFAYIFARANALGLPCVVNLSSSDNLGGHDGSTNGEQFMDNLLLTNGRAITCASGNTQTRGSHATGTVAQGATTNLTVNYTAAGTREDTIQVYYDGHDRFSITLTVPTGPATIIGPVAAGGTLTQNVAGMTVTINSVLNDPRNNDNYIEVRMTGVSGANPIVAGNWVLALTGTTVINGNFDAWIDRTNRTVRSFNPATTVSGTLAVPASALRALTVGSHNGNTPVTISNFSSRGPSRDGRIKPEIAAMGNNMVMSRSRNMSLLNPGGLTANDTGTSFAAPIVAGACALLFECRGAGLSWADLKQIITNTAAIPPAPAVTPGNRFGFGSLNMQNACATPLPDIDVWLRDNIDDDGVEPYPGAVAWRSPDIEVLDAGGNPTANPTHDPANLWNNIIRVTARNRGTQVARNVQLFLHWADPGTNLPYPDEWRIDGIYTGDPNFVVQGNVVVIPQIPAMGSVQVQFAWAPPAPGTNVRGDDHFCLLARIESEGDPSNVNTGGWPVIKGSNNIALRNTHIIEAEEGDGDSAFFFRGTEDIDGLEISTEGLEQRVEIIFPVAALPWRDLELMEKIGGKRKPFGSDCKELDPLLKMKKTLKPEEAYMVTGILGVSAITIVDGLAHLFTDIKSKKLELPDMRVISGARLPIRVRVKDPKVGGRPGQVHVTQRSGGRRTGGVTIEFHKEVPKQKKYRVFRDGDKVVVKNL